MNSLRQPVSFIATDRPEATETFYADVLGLKLQEVTPFALVFLDAGHPLRVQIVPKVQPAGYTVYGWEVTDIETEMETLISNGVEFQRFAELPQDASEVWTTPDGNKIAWFKDPSGNTLSLTQYV